MAEILYTGYAKGSDNNLYEWTITDEYICMGEDYVEDGYVTVEGVGTGERLYNHQIQYKSAELQEITINSTYTYGAMYLDKDTDDVTDILKAYHVQVKFTQDGGETIYTGTVLPQWGMGHSSLTNMEFEMSTNLPLFETQADAIAYCNAESTADRIIALRKAINFKKHEELTLKEYSYITRARNYTVDQYGNITENTAQGEVIKGFRIKTYHTSSVYRKPGITDGKLEMGINLGDTPEVCYYTTDGYTWNMVPGAPTTLPYDWIYRPWEGEETGTFWASVSDPLTNMYEFHTKEASDAYNAGETEGRDAINYGLIDTGDYKNPTGDESETTTFGEVKTRGFFSQQYILDSTAITDIAGALYDTTAGGIWEDIKKGLDMYGDNPIEAVMGLSFWPIDLTAVITNKTSTTHVYFGGYMHSLGSGTAYKINYPNGYKSLGNIVIRKSFNNWRDYNPYTRIFVRLPYVGCYELDPSKYYNKNTEVRYYFDTRTGSCIACLIADGHLMDYWNGQMAVSMPMTLTDFSGYANAQIQTLLGMGGQTISTGMNAASAAPAVTAAGAGATALGVAGLGVGGALMGAKSVYGLTQNNINKFNQTRGGSSPMINEYLPQYVEFIFEIQEDCAPSNYGEMFGYPSMKTGSVGSFGGFLKVASVKLSCPGVTENEKQQILSLLNSGIYI